ncbi:MAG: ATP-binding protein [Muribaculaceae bacterium]|nr:ATP-binding protein [Muribaculaceae bacterium]
MRELKNSRLKKETKPRKTRITVSPPTSILEAFERIVELAEDSNLDSNFLKKAAPQISYASEKLGISEQQTILLALFVDKSESSRILISEIAEYIGCSTTRILRLSKDVDALVELKYLKVSKSQRNVSYRMPWEVIEALKNDSPFIPIKGEISDTASFFDEFAKLMKEKEDDEITYDKIMEHTEEMLEAIRDSTFAKELRKYDLCGDERILFIFMAYLYVENDDNCIGFHDIDNLYDNCDIPTWCKRELRKGDSELFYYKLIEFVNEDGMARTDSFKLTDHAKETMLPEIQSKNIGKSQKGLIKYDSLTAKELIYNSNEKSNIEELTSILTQGRFQGVQERLQKAGMRKGFCCLFYGAPGTGKTETVYQIARKTGRNIMKVDVDKVKSCWVGESEKNIKAIFDRYRNICQNSDLVPILLFNEADAVLGVRMEGAARAVDKMENSIQNIILQEMESLEGIMIATTNLTNNLDKAFERRFLYKVRYEKPTVEARKKIWEIMLPAISEESAQILAGKFDMSGGEIENIARKHTVNAILSGDESIDLTKISEMCLKERIVSKTQRVGF